MRIADFVITAAVVGGLSGTALAQTTTTAPTVQNAAPATYSSDNGGDWFASAYLGSNFGSGGTTAFDNLNNLGIDTGSTASVNFGGEIGYAWNATWGAEFMLNYAPNFELTDSLLQRRPRVATYMANALYALPIDTEHRFRPFVSGGIGAMQLRSTIFTIDPASTNLNVALLDTERADRTQFAWDLGGGVMAFNGAWGLRADVRYYKATTDNALNDGTVSGIFFQRELSGLSFWNANFGVAFRW